MREEEARIQAGSETVRNRDGSVLFDSRRSGLAAATEPVSLFIFCMYG